MSDAEERLKNYLNDKAIAYVCPGYHLVGKELGTYIDSFDVVIRCGQNFNIPEQCKKDYGNRTDILITNFNGFTIDSMIRTNDNLYIRNMKFIISLIWPDNDSANILKNQFGFNMDNLYVFTQAERELCFLPHTGFIGLGFLLKLNIKKMFLCGMSFYNMGEFGRIWYDELFDDQAKADELTSMSDVVNRTISKRILDMPGSHSISSEIECFRNVLLPKYKNKLELDFYLKEKFGG